jgi:glycosyltransferase involved in cell wall biosynthesis
MHDTPLVSILMNCFNGERYLSDAIDSVINQTYSNWELIFWDNQSTDKSKAIFDSYEDDRLKYHYSNEHTDLGGGRANAFKYLSGDFIAVLDTDDLWLPDKLKKQLNMFNDPEVGIVICDTIFFNERTESLLYDGNYPPEGKVFRTLLTNYFVSLETLMLRKSFVNKLSYAFDPDFSFIADFDLVLRVAKISKLAICKEVLAKWRVHNKSDSWQSPISFALEKEKWIKKQALEDPMFVLNYQNELSELHKKNFRSMAISYILMKQRLDGFRAIINNKPYSFNDYKVIILCFMPFSRQLILLLQKRKALS